MRQPSVHDQFYDSPTTNYQQKKQIRSPRSLKTLCLLFFYNKVDWITTERIIGSLPIELRDDYNKSKSFKNHYKIIS